MQCGDESGSYFLKYDELDDGVFEGLVSPHEGVFSCPEGEVIAVFIKSGRNAYDGPSIDGLPRGSGAAWYPQACSVAESGCDSGGEEGGGDENADTSEWRACAGSGPAGCQTSAGGPLCAGDPARPRGL